MTRFPVHIDSHSLLGEAQEKARTRGLGALLGHFERAGILQNFRRIAKGQLDPMHAEIARSGWPSADADVAKWIEAAVRLGRFDLAEPIIDLAIQAQAPDGYLYTGITDPAERYQHLDYSQELFCQGQFIEAFLAHHRVTGSQHSFDAAIRIGDHLLASFGKGRKKIRERADTRPGIERALVTLSRATGNHAYLKLAKHFIELQLGPNAAMLYSIGGHAASALELVDGVTQYAIAAKNKRMREVVERIYSEIVRTRTYITGAVGGRWLGQALGRPYELPHDAAYAETCAIVAAAKLHSSIGEFGSEKSLGWADSLETVIHNALLGTTSREGDEWFCANPQGATGDWENNLFGSHFDVYTGDLPPERWWEREARTVSAWNPPRRRPWFDITCCPPNAMRMIAELSELVLDVSNVASTKKGHPARTHLRIDQWTSFEAHSSDLTSNTSDADSNEWSLQVGTEYPWNGNIHVLLRTATPILFSFRVPGWSASTGIEASATLNGTPLDARLVPGSYTEIELPAGEHVLEFDFPMLPVAMAGHPQIVETRHSIALMRGPVVYVIEALDQIGVDVRTVSFDPDGALTVREGADHYTGLYTIHGTGDMPLFAPTAPYDAWKPGPDAHGIPVDLTFAPYFSWANRGVTPMVMWLPLRTL